MIFVEILNKNSNMPYLGNEFLKTVEDLFTMMLYKEISYYDQTKKLKWSLKKPEVYVGDILKPIS